jgi:hypothetical protein
MMIHATPRRTLSLAAGLTLVALAADPPHAAAARTWNYSLAAAASSGYDYRVDEHSFGTYESSFGPGFAVTGSAARAVSRHTSLVLSGGYRRYSEAFGVVATELPPTTGELRAEFFSIGAGLRIEPRQGSGLYMQMLLPALFVSRWNESTVEEEGWSMMTGAWQSGTTHTDSFTSAQPGFELSAGFRARLWSALGTDFGVRFTSSADLGKHTLGRFSSGDFQGLNELALVGGITWSP